MESKKPSDPLLFGMKLTQVGFLAATEISLRDVFAAIALGGYMAKNSAPTASDRQFAAMRVYNMADEMLKAREVEDEG